MKIKGSVPKGDIPPGTKTIDPAATHPPAAEAPAAVSQAGGLPSAGQQASIQEEWKRLQRLRHRALERNLTGAANLFSDGVYFPPNLLDANNPKNDANYLRLLAAVLGLNDSEESFPTESDEENPKDDDSSSQEN